MSGQGLLKVSPVPVHGGAGAEAREEVVEAGESGYADCEEAERGGVEEKRFGVDPFPDRIVSMGIKGYGWLSM